MNQQPETTLDFLGTGGGRYVMMSQLRRTAGIRLTEGETQVHIDPGPGALVFSNWAGLSPSKLKGLIVTHCHPDHYNDCEVFIEGMTRGITVRRGVLAGTKSVLQGAEGIGPCISGYHQRIIENLVILKEGTSFKVEDLKFTATDARHSDPHSVGLRIETMNGKIGYTSDTRFFPELPASYMDLRLLILCTMWPRGKSNRIHLNTDDALRILEEAKPRACILTHFGMRMLNAGPEKEAEYLSEETGIPVYAAMDGLKANLGEKITLKGPGKSDESIEIDG